MEQPIKFPNPSVKERVHIPKSVNRLYCLFGGGKKKNRKKKTIKTDSTRVEEIKKQGITRVLATIQSGPELERTRIHMQTEASQFLWPSTTEDDCELHNFRSCSLIIPRAANKRDAPSTNSIAPDRIYTVSLHQQRGWRQWRRWLLTALGNVRTSSPKFSYSVALGPTLGNCQTLLDSDVISYGCYFDTTGEKVSRILRYRLEERTERRSAPFVKIHEIFIRCLDTQSVQFCSVCSAENFFLSSLRSFFYPLKTRRTPWSLV